LNYGKITSAALDPIEKKPLYHWRPGSRILSLGGVMCNFSCGFCQNHSLSDPDTKLISGLREVSAEELVSTAQRLGVPSVAYTYNEPTLQAEYITDAASSLRRAGIASVMVTNGSFSPAAREELIAVIDAMNIDVKTFDEKTYDKLSGGRGTLRAVTDNVERLAAAGVHVELTCLVVPGVSDGEADFEAMTDWMAGVSPDMPLHISRYFPAYKYDAPPTDVGLMKKFRRIAEGKLKYVHLGNVW
jgi:pyruvate formate lyase activating enzyme